jgi:hypothetical protein
MLNWKVVLHDNTLFKIKLILNDCVDIRGWGEKSVRLLLLWF